MHIRSHLKALSMKRFPIIYRIVAFRWKIYNLRWYNEKKIWDKLSLEFFDNCELILDVGCGIGRFMTLDPQRVLGVDWSKLSVRTCVNKGLTAMVANATNLPFQDESFDGVHCSHVIEHLVPKDAYILLFELGRVIRPGGILIIRSPLPWKGFYSDLTHVKPYLPRAILSYCLPKEQRTLSTLPFHFDLKKLLYRHERTWLVDRYIPPEHRPESKVFSLRTRRILSNIIHGLHIRRFKRNAYMLVLTKTKYA